MARGKGGGSRRTTRWVTLDSAPNGLVGGTPEQAAIQTASGTLVGSTVLRVVGNVQFHGTATNALTTEYACGIIVSPGTMDTADQDPAVNVDLDWLYWRQMGFLNVALEAAASSWVTFGFDLDVRGRRKISEGESLFYVETMTGQNGNSYVNLRVLLLNP